MQRIIKRYFWIALLAAGLQTSWGFALLGPETLANGADAWQTAVIGYHYAYADSFTAGDPVFLGDVGGPRNIAEEYRRNVPVMYYTYDQTFINFFGLNGVAAVDSAYAMMNTVPSADKMDLSLYPLESMQANYTAQADFLTDIKSVTLHLLVEQLGLADPERFVWTLHDRIVVSPPGCPLGVFYTVVQRNLDYLPSTLNNIQYSSYINDNLYSYFLVENCTGPNPLAFTVPFLTDPEAVPYTAVAANNFDGLGLIFLNNSGNQPLTLSGGLQVGYFYTGLTRDDAAGFKYLFRTNNVNLELPETTSLLFSVTTNLTLQQLFPNGNGTNNTGTNAGFYFFDGTFGYGDYGALVAASLTNSPAVLQALYPGLLIASSSNYFVIATNWTFAQYFTNSGVGQPYPPPLVLVTVSNAHPFLLEKFVTKFANVFRDPGHHGNSSPNTIVKRQTISVVPNTGAPYPAPPVTNVTTQTITYAGVPSGDFILLTLFHTNVCPIDIIRTGLTNVLATTNFLAGASTNVVTPTNTSSFSSTLIQISYFTNYTFIINAVNCAEVANAANNYQGIGGTKFARADFDSLIGQFFQPATNYYNMVALTNSQWVVEHFVRVVTRPDILMDAVDQGLPNTFIGSVTRTIPNFAPSPVLNGLAGPGTINSPTTFTYDKIGDSFWNGYLAQVIGYADLTQFLGQYGSIPALAWASFDASTNAPVLYPDGASIQNLEAVLAVHFSPVAAPDGFKGVGYSQTFTVSGGTLQAPLAWSASGGNVFSGLPPGMSVATALNGVDFILSGTPASSGTFDFILQLSDSTGRSMQWNEAITIH